MRLRPLLIGGSQENGRRAGTENVASIVGLGKAAERAGEAMEEEQTSVRAMRDRFESGLTGRIAGARVNGNQRHAGCPQYFQPQLRWDRIRRSVDDARSTTHLLLGGIRPCRAQAR